MLVLLQLTGRAPRWLIKIGQRAGSQIKSEAHSSARFPHPRHKRRWFTNSEEVAVMQMTCLTHELLAHDLSPQAQASRMALLMIYLQMNQLNTFPLFSITSGVAEVIGVGQTGTGWKRRQMQEMSLAFIWVSTSEQQRLRGGLYSYCDINEHVWAGMPFLWHIPEDI